MEWKSQRLKRANFLKLNTSHYWGLEIHKFANSLVR